jgi:hypothetical protein
MNLFFRYKTQFFQYIVRALSIASKLSLRIDAAGILCAQFLIYTEKDKPSLVEYFVSLFKFIGFIIIIYLFSLDLMKNLMIMKKIHNRVMPF